MASSSPPPTSAAWSLQAVGTTCTLLANARMMRHVCASAPSPVPRAVLCLQMAASCSWLAYASMTSQSLLAASSVANLTLHVSTLVTLLCATRTRATTTASARRPTIPSCDSEDMELPRL